MLFGDNVQWINYVYRLFVFPSCKQMKNTQQQRTFWSSNHVSSSGENWNGKIMREILSSLEVIHSMQMECTSPRKWNVDMVYYKRYNSLWNYNGFTIHIFYDYVQLIIGLKIVKILIIKATHLLYSLQIYIMANNWQNVLQMCHWIQYKLFNITLYYWLNDWTFKNNYKREYIFSVGVFANSVCY